MDLAPRLAEKGNASGFLHARGTYGGEFNFFLKKMTSENARK
jgi:hypothetical protein